MILWKGCNIYTLSEHLIRYLLDLCFRLKSSAAVAYPLKGLMHCVFRDALLHTTVVMCGNAWLSTFLSALSSLALLLWPLSLTRCLCRQSCCSLDVFYFSYHSLQTPETAVHENPRRSAVSEMLKPPCLALASFCSQSHLDPISCPLWHLVWKTAVPLDYVCIMLGI